MREAYSRNDIKGDSDNSQKLISPAGIQLVTTRREFPDGVTVQLAAKTGCSMENNEKEYPEIITRNL